MTKLYVRILLGVIVAVTVSFLFFSVFIAAGIGEDLNANLPPDIRSSSELVQNLSYQMEEADFERLVEKTYAKSKIPARIVALEEDVIPAKLRQELSRGEIRWLLEETKESSWKSGLTIYIPVSDYSRVYVIGPDTYLPLPDMGDLVFVACLVGVLVLIVAVVITRPLHKDLKRLEKAAKELEQGKLNARANVRSKNAIGFVGGRFDAMAQRIQHLLENRGQMIQAIAHELRTPVARIRFGVEMMAEEEQTQERESRAKSIEDDLEELERMISEFLLYVRYDDVYCDNESFPPYSLVSCVETQVARLSPLHGEKSVAIQKSENSTLSLSFDHKATDRLVHNLVSNALRYAKKEVQISIGETAGKTTLMIDDDGPGIPADKRASVTEPFVRLDSSRSRDSGGVGLGLSIVSRILEQQRGVLSISASPMGGTRIEVTWAGS